MIIQIIARLTWFRFESSSLISQFLLFPRVNSSDSGLTQCSWVRLLLPKWLSSCCSTLPDAVPCTCLLPNQILLFKDSLLHDLKGIPALCFFWFFFSFFFLMASGLPFANFTSQIKLIPRGEQLKTKAHFENQGWVHFHWSFYLLKLRIN